MSEPEIDSIKKMLESINTKLESIDDSLRGNKDKTGLYERVRSLEFKFWILGILLLLIFSGQLVIVGFKDTIMGILG